MKTEILKIKGSWEEVVDDCRATVSKLPLGHDPRASFKRHILIAEHSPIRDLSVRFRWTGIKYWIAMHWKTHHWESKVSTQRSDRTGTPRDKLPQDAPVNFTGEMNAQAAIDTMRKRLTTKRRRRHGHTQRTSRQPCGRRNRSSATCWSPTVCTAAAARR